MNNALGTVHWQRKLLDISNCVIFLYTRYAVSWLRALSGQSVSVGAGCRRWFCERLCVLSRHGLGRCWNHLAVCFLKVHKILKSLALRCPCFCHVLNVSVCHLLCIYIYIHMFVRTPSCCTRCSAFRIQSFFHDARCIMYFSEGSTHAVTIPSNFCVPF